MDTLIRMPVEPRGSIDLDQQLLKEAESYLGYKAGTTGIWNAEADRKVETALAELGIAPFAIESVVKYKAAKAENKNLTRLGYAAASMTAIAILSCVIAIFFQPAIWGLLFLAGGVVCVIAASECKEFSWRHIPIHEYAGDVPEFALQTAIDVKKRIGSDVGLFVEELRIDERRPDPFLVARSNSGKLYYLEVWNEPGFKIKRTE